ncbi:hypothetical protein Dsin_017290 [Dipteronia sinensis]|uniref:Reverse transcriptase zinc-binding domain-containing protein n=1 Tax=Dipteronia sinensis TaxID=43782 RepID=A0AAE0E6E3_9ROSI|nr:hypothetical protein Dsin_017290 [Dipteronia sinensis]
MVYNSGLPLNATVNAIVLGDSGSWPATMSIDLVEIRSQMPSYNPNSNIEDSIRWLPSSNGIYSASSALASLRVPHPLVPWFKLVWFPQNIQRMSFILWMAVRASSLTAAAPSSRGSVTWLEGGTPSLSFVPSVPSTQAGSAWDSTIPAGSTGPLPLSL